MSEHILVIEPDTEYREKVNAYRIGDGLEPYAEDEWDEHFTWSVICHKPEHCNGWIECDKEHAVDGYDGPNDGPWDYDTDSPPPWAELEEFEFHGELHEWKWGYGWTTPYPGCVLQGNVDWDVPDELYPLRAGRWIVDDDWDDTDVSLSVVREVTDA